MKYDQDQQKSPWIPKNPRTIINRGTTYFYAKSASTTPLFAKVVTTYRWPDGN
ncbi:hypothetical protein [Loigolactobacillus backii]|uniref:hypothetical protein n=1 Tax=Loigolactobacillus backii TaxID=375175 RepID=UPI000A59EE0B|nr:hypothetical protein [Loigolactobacillus backii]